MTILALFERCAARHGRLTALKDLATGRTLDFSALLAALFSVHDTLAAQGWNGPGNRVGLLIPDAFDTLVHDYGLMASGHVRVALDPALSAQEQAAQLLDAGATGLLCGHDNLAHARDVARLAGGLPCLPVAVAPPPAARPAPPATWTPPPPDALASLSYTGGTTGMPKAVAISHANLCAAVSQIVEARGVGPGEVMLNMRPVWPIAAIVLLAQLAAGGAVVLGGRFEPDRFLALLASERAQSASLVPTHLVRILDFIDERGIQPALPDLRSIEVGAAALTRPVFERLLQWLGPRIAIIYGLTEAPWSCYLPAWGLADPARREQRLSSVGMPLAHVQVVPRHADGRACAVGEEGEITIRGPHVAQGYWKHPDLTDAAFRQGWFHTGDLGRVDADGWLYITGRIKEIIRSGGKSVVPLEVEQALRLHPSVADAVVLGTPNAEWGEVVTAVVVARDPARADLDALRAALQQHCDTQLSSHKKPRLYHFVQEIPRSHYGKPLLKQIRSMLEPQPAEP